MNRVASAGTEEGQTLTVTTFLATALPHVFVVVYLMVSVPAETPVTVPVGFTVAIAVFA
ncbi:MAG: hypothetical protein H7257_12550 [Taibaiella sp.]|nr:hypothetical protein [Taibaiella sp.]